MREHHPPAAVSLDEQTHMNSALGFSIDEVAVIMGKLTLDVADLNLLSERQGGDVDLCSRALLQEVHKFPLLPDQSTNQMLQRQDLL